MQEASARLLPTGLLEFANTGKPPELKQLLDMEVLPELDATHPDFERRLQSRQKAIRHNTANYEKKVALRPIPQPLAFIVLGTTCAWLAGSFGV